MLVKFATPIGCLQNGLESFVGESSGSTPNFAGGAPSRGWAGVVAGQNNESCDGESGIVSGGSNIVGGDGSSDFGFIGGGGLNQLEQAQWSGILSGFDNLIGSTGIIGGAGNSGIGSGTFNDIGSSRSFIGAGNQNLIFVALEGPYGQSAFIGAGVFNTVTGNESAVVAGNGNAALPDFSAVVGGYHNSISSAATIDPNGQSAFIGGGSSNSVSANFAGILAGQQNSAAGDYASIGGGYLNIASGVQAAVGGGYGNIASGKNGTIPGGTTNVASGSNSFAAGTKSTAGFTGDFVWSDYVGGSTGVSATAEDQFVARATGGFYLYSSKSLTGVALAPGSGAWSTLSDRHVKTGIENVDDTRILAKLAAMPISEWSYKAQGTGIRHLGPMAQDFRAAFGLGEDDRHISTVDEEGVALAAIKALKRENDDLQAENAAKDREIAELRRAQSDARSAQSEADQRLEAKYARLEQRLDALEAHGQPATTESSTTRS